MDTQMLAIIQRGFLRRVRWDFVFFSVSRSDAVFFFILGSIFWAEAASHVSVHAWLSLLTSFSQPICLFPKVITLE